MEENNTEKRLYLMNVIGKEVIDIMEDLENLSNNFLESHTESFIKYGNSIYFVSEYNIEDLSHDIRKIMTNKFAYTLFDITDNLSFLYFRGNLNDSHFNSKEFTEMFESFLEDSDDYDAEMFNDDDDDDYDDEMDEFCFDFINKGFDSKRFQIVEKKTDKELLNEAIESEDYETAAILRDKIIKSKM